MIGRRYDSNQTNVVAADVSLKSVSHVNNLCLSLCRPEQIEPLMFSLFFHSTREVTYTRRT